MSDDAAINTALVAAQGEFGQIVKDQRADAGRRGVYGYLSHDALNAAVVPVLTKHGLAVVQKLESRDDGLWLLTELRHAEGGQIDSAFRFPYLPDDWQGLGSAISYARRYVLLALLNIAPADDDDDGRAASASRARPTPERAPGWSERTRGAIFATLHELQAAHPPPDSDDSWQVTARRYVKQTFGHDSMSELSEREAQQLLGSIRARQALLDQQQARDVDAAWSDSEDAHRDEPDSAFVAPTPREDDPDA